MSSPSPPLVVTVGEPAGIGADVILQAWNMQAKGEIPPLPALVILSDPDVLSHRSKALGLETSLQVIKNVDDTQRSMRPGHLCVLKLRNDLKGLPAKPASGDAAGIIEAITTAVDLVRRGKAGGVVTLPINKKSLYDAGFEHPGHTEFLGALAENWPEIQKPVRPVMMLAGPELRAVPVTIHIPLKDVPEKLTTGLIVETITITDRDLRNRFGIARPRIAVSGLNPHAGEGGALGHEDESVVLPAINTLKQAGIDCFGPLPADTMFHAAARKNYDVAVCMYHDQALIPAKALAFDDSVNVTLGLPFVRTSPDHGTAYDIAGTGKANPASTIAAIRLAKVLTRAAGA